MIYRIFLSLVLIIAAFVACKDKKFEHTVRETVGKSVFLEHLDSLQPKPKFTILRVLDNPSCSSCELHLGDWKVYRRRLHRDFGDSINIVFIIQTRNTKETTNLLKMYKFHHNSLVGEEIKLLKTNNFSEELGKDFVLLDAENRVLSIGNPCSNEVAEHNFDKIFYSSIKPKHRTKQN